MEKNKKNIIINTLSIIFIICVFIGLIWYMLKVDGIDNIIKVLQNVEYSWLGVGLLLTVIYWILEGMCFYVITKKIYKKQRFISSFRLAMIGRLFNNITPFSCGDQPAQLLVMKQEGKTFSNGASILLTRFIAYQAVLVVYTLIIMIFKYSYFKTLVSNFVYLAIIGFVINLFVILFLIALAINEKMVLNIVNFFIKLLGKIKIIKKVDEKMKKFHNIVADFQEQFKIMKKEKMMIFKLCLYTLIEITVLYSITYVVYRAFGQNAASFIQIFSAQALLALIVVYMPTPGAGAIAEGSFYILFSTFFKENTIYMAILFWRMFTFYLPILVGSIFLVYKPKIIPEDDISEKIEESIT
ncbi:MAG: lysylphosphatidylglycerol synthase transmembrane domain-containing protein [Clostridia bacterium]